MSRDLSPREAADRFLSRRQQRQAEETVRSYAHRLSHFVEWCEEQEIEQMREVGGWEIDEYRHYRESDDVSPSTVKSAMVSLKQLLEFCERIEVADEDVFFVGVAAELDCAPNTASEHLQKGEAKLVRAGMTGLGPGA